MEEEFKKITDNEEEDEFLDSIDSLDLDD